MWNLRRMIMGRLYSPDDNEGIGDITDLDEMNDEKDEEVDKDDDNDDSGDDNVDDDNDDDSEKKDKKEKSKKDDDKGDDKDDDEDKEDEEEEEEDKDKIEEEERITHVKDIKVAFPDFFKKFPDVKAALYRDQRYGEMFGTPDEAETAVEKAGILDKIEDDLIKQGNPTELLNTIKKGDTKSYEKVVSGVFDYIKTNDKELYLEVSAVPIKQLLRACWNEGKGNDTNLGRAAAFIHRWFFNNLNFDDKPKFENREDTKETDTEKRLREKIEQIDQREFTNFKSAVDTSYVTRMTSSIREGLDKDDRLTEYAKSKLVEDIMIDIKNQLNKDARHMNHLNSIWRKAKDSGYTNDFKSSLVNTALARAKSLIPATRQRLVAEALKTSKKKEEKTLEKDKDDKPSQRRSSNPPRRESKIQTDLDILRS